MKIFVRRLKDLRAITDKFLNAIVASLPKMPYGASPPLPTRGGADGVIR